jgi:FkbM family methyltransferase
MSVAQSIARKLPSRWRAFGRDWFETHFRGVPRGVLKHREALLRLDFDMVVAHYRVKHPEVRCLQIGAFDGITGDCMYPMVERHGLKGVLVEPQRDAFARLTANYSRFPGFQFVNAAIAAQDGSTTLYGIKHGTEGPAWLHQIASFDRKVLMRHASMIPNLESMVETETVRTMTFATLFKETGMERVDLLQVDAEGFDAEILRLFDIPARKPPIVRFEHKHLSIANHENCVGMLVDQGYKIVVCGSDTLAYLTAQAPSDYLMSG